MWIRVVLALISIVILIKLSEETCETIRLKSDWHYSTILCTNITPNDDIYNNITTIKRSDIQNLILANSSIPEFSKNICRFMNFINITIHANVEVIQNNTFRDCRVGTLTLDYNHIKKIDDMGFSSAFLRVLSLQNNGLNVIKVNNFQGLSQLNTLNLRYNNISEIEEDSFDHLENLEELDLSFNKLVELHFGQFQGLKRLQIIYLNNNLLKELSDHIFSQCEALKSVNIENNFITIIDARSYPNSISIVNASNNQLMSADFSNLINVDTIDLNHNNLKSVVSSLRNLTSLKFLHISYNSFGPSINLTKMQNLNQLDLSYNNLEEIWYDTFKNTPELHELWLQHNAIRSIEFGCFRNLGKLQELNLNRNKINNFMVGDIPSLKYLYLSYNEFGPSINFCKMQNLNVLDLTYNNLEEIRHDTFDNTTDLEQLRLQHNSINSIELGSFRNLGKLQILNLTHNTIKSFELGIFSGLYGLNTLDISYNSLSHLDKNIFHGTMHLENLNIAYNSLKGVEIINMRSRTVGLKKVTLTGTEWSCHSLVDFLRSDIIVTRGTSHNVSNIFGVPCNNTDDDNNNTRLGEFGNSGNFTKLLEYLETNGEYEKQSSYKMTIIIVLLIALIIMFSVKFAFAKCCSWYISIKELISKKCRDEQEIQLM